MSVLWVDGVSKSFGKKKVLDNISLEVLRGEILGVIGESGSGKTTLLKTIIGFNRPEHGDVFLGSGSRRLSVFNNRVLAKRMIGFASQEPSFYERLTVEENLYYFGALHGLDARGIKRRARELLSTLNLADARKTVSDKLSGGMERRLDIALALVHDPKILILDEPTSDLDPKLRSDIWRMVRGISQRGKTIILASHHLSEVESFCSRIALLKNGKIAELASPSALRARHSKGQEIRIESYPGNYAGVAKSLGGLDVAVRGSVLIVYCSRPNEVLSRLLAVLKEHGEEVTDITVSRPTLDELFPKMSGSSGGF